MMRRTRTPQQSLRIAMVAACPFPSPRGSQVLIRELAQAVADHGHEVHLVTYPYGENLVPIHGILVHRVHPPRWAAAASASLGWRRLLLDGYVALMLYRVVRRHQIHVIHAHNYEGQLIGYLVRWLTGVPVVYHSHNALSDELGYYFKSSWCRSAARALGRMLDWQLPRRADFSIALTPELKHFLTARGVADDRSVVIPPGVAPAAAPDVPVEQGDAFGGRFVVMYAGNLDAYQDLDVLYEAFATAQADLPPSLLVVVTHEGQWRAHIRGRLEALLRQDQARIIVAPAFSVVRRFLARADVLVCPRSSWSGFPIKLINYMAAGRALVAAEGSAKAIVDGETGLVFANRDVAGLADALRRLSADAALRRQLGDHARAAANALYGWRGIVGQIEAIYSAVRVPPPADTLRGAGRAGVPRRLIGLSKGRLSVASRGRSD